ncbi:MAG TPA: L-2-amino-thiazoline-4-carboxylic acid hydrolase [Firmicutes bacterium]|nr:L-2-amino-thiazoline-4-carboxylic acid hydrolase [Bacillota bacterium]
MNISETTFSFLQQDCIKEFGNQKGKELFESTEQMYQHLLNTADYKNSEVIQDHLKKKLFPPMAYYKVLLAEGYEKGIALDYVKKETHKAALVKKEEMKRLAKMPFAYAIYRMGVKRYMRKNFPDEGWETQWVRCDNREIHFNLHRCIYSELSKAYGCPELCCVYCENDDISFSGLLPKIKFKRTGTLGSGSSCCDFHFIKA